MPYVKLDCGMLDSSLWNVRIEREMFITALLMAKPKDLLEPMDTFDRTGRPQAFKVPPGENYGFVEASGSGIARRALLFGVQDEDAAAAMDVESYDWEDALYALAAPDKESRTPDFEGRRMVRVSGGFIILNFGIYREKDSSTDRVRKHREKKKAETAAAECNVTGVTETVTKPGNGRGTQAEAEAEAKTPPTPSKGESESKGFQEFYSSYPRKEARPRAWKAWKTQKAESHLPAILAALEAKWPHQSWLGLNKKYLPLPASWINDRRWEDDVEKEAPPATQEQIDLFEVEMVARGMRFSDYQDEVHALRRKNRGISIAGIKAHFDATPHEELI